MKSIPFLFYEAFVNLRRHSLMTAAAITTIAVALGLMGSFAVTFYQVSTAMKKTVADFEMQIFCREEVTKPQLHAIRLRLEAIPGVVRPVGYVSREQAFKDQTKGLPIDTSDIPNRFNETFVVKLSDPRRASQIAHEIRGWQDVVQEVALPEQEMGGVLRIAGFIRLVGAVGGALLLLGALVVVSNTVRISLFSRRREIRIMQIVGATPYFIRLPLFIEGMIHGIAGGLVASLGLALTARYVNQLIVQTIPMMARYFDIGLDMVAVSAAVIGIGALIGAGGSLLSMGRYMKAM